MLSAKADKNQNRKEKEKEEEKAVHKSSEITRIVRPTQPKIIRHRLDETTISPPSSTDEHRAKDEISSSTREVLTTPVFTTITTTLPQTTTTPTPTTSPIPSKTSTTTTAPPSTTTSTSTKAKIKVGLTENIPLALLQTNGNSDESLNVILNDNEKKQNTLQNDLTRKNEEIASEPSRTLNQNISIKALSCHFGRMIAYLDVRNIKDNFNIYLRNSSCKFFVNTLNVVQDTIELPINYNSDCGTILSEHGSHYTYANKLYFGKALNGVRGERSPLTAKCRLKKTDRTSGQMHAKLKKSGKVRIVF